MNNKLLFGTLLSLTAASIFANQQPTGNNNPAYGNSTVQAQLRLNIKDGAETVHFVRDTNDPKIITKTYILKHADANSIRPYLREMVQSASVDYNNAAGRSNTDFYNVYSKDNKAKTQKIFVPCGVECVRFADGTEMLIISAEEYRFKNSPSGMGIDELVARLDQPGIKNSSGQPKFIYYPLYRSASELQSLIKSVGANVSNDTTELIGGKDKIEVDSDLNALFFNTALYSKPHIEKMLKLYDKPHAQIKVSCTVYELESENDGMPGVDFQSGKNNNGVHLLQTGANLTRNYNIKDVLTAITANGTVNTDYFNFNPKWNTKFLDFLVSKGKAQVVSTGSITIESGETGKFTRKSGVLYAALEKIPSREGEAEHGNAVNVKSGNEKFKFEFSVTPEVGGKASVLNLSVNTCSMLGYNSDGSIRSSDFSTTQRVTITNNKKRFYLGGIEKTQQVRINGGVPLLKDIPLLGWVFSTERESLKKTQLVVVADCEIVLPETEVTPPAMEFKHGYGYGQLLINPEKK